MAFQRGVASIELSFSRYVVRDRLGSNYKGMLTLDGGGTRCMLTVMMLRQLEKEIKRHLFEKRVVCKCKGNKVMAGAQSIADFDIDLGNYFQFVAGVSMGSVIAAYIAVRGKGSDNLVEVESFRKGCVSFCKEVIKAHDAGNTTEIHEGISKEAAESVVVADSEVAAEPDAARKLTQLKKKIKKAFPQGSMRRLEVVFRYCTAILFGPDEACKSDSQFREATAKTIVAAAKDAINAVVKDDRHLQELAKQFTAPMDETLAAVSGGLPSKQGPESFMKSVLGDTRASEVKTNLMVSVFDQLTHKGYCFVARREEGSEDVKIFLREEGWVDDGVVATPGVDLRNLSKTEFGGLGTPRGDVTSYLNQSIGQAGLTVVSDSPVTENGVPTLYLSDLTRASAAIPRMFDTVVMHIEKAAGQSDDASREIGTVALSDGASLSNDPTLQALPVQLDPKTEIKPEELAIMSVGSGLTYGPVDWNDGGEVQWNKVIQQVSGMTSETFSVQQIETTSRFIPAALAYSLQHDHHFKKGQYTRLQIITKTAMQAEAFEQITNPDLVGHIYDLGKEVVDNSEHEVNQQIKSFVREYIFGEPRDGSP